jgi:hypothetical protein
VCESVGVACLELTGEEELGVPDGFLVVQTAAGLHRTRVVCIICWISFAVMAKSGTTFARDPPSGLKSIVVRRFVSDVGACWYVGSDR